MSAGRISSQNQVLENQEQLKSVFIRYIRNECSPDEVKWLIDHFETGKDENELRAMIRAA